MKHKQDIDIKEFDLGFLSWLTDFNNTKSTQIPPFFAWTMIRIFFSIYCT